MNESSAPDGEITQLLGRVAEGDRAAENALIPLVYDELRHLAYRHMRKERVDHTLQPTAVVHEAYVRLLRQGPNCWQNRIHFYAVASNLMRNILVDHARITRARKRGGNLSRTQLSDTLIAADDRTIEILGVDEALTRLASWDPRQARIVELRFFAGLSNHEIAELLGISDRTVKRDWVMAQAWLRGELFEDGRHDARALGEN